ncbi:hypothetical protein [Camelimonas lactis]|uniref:Uncharacterized protein n=1 Tax=Camelimonas lactis TaxID=659006 RepID=A0A4R2GHK1_9HYPH|nr:hypothetical protein [Camelimonas lactis]TCO07595.1 hypothetical protein EV666_1306 [Camelimonas lactis]
MIAAGLALGVFAWQTSLGVRLGFPHAAVFAAICFFVVGMAALFLP